MNDNFDAFISYRQKDGTQLASWLRNWLLNYKLPRTLHKQHSAPGRARRKIWFDAIQKFASNDYFEQQICPAVQNSRCLIVVSTPSVYKHEEGESGEHVPNWVDREITVFRQCNDENLSKAVIVAQFHSGEFPGPVPSGLNDLPYLSQIDLRAAAPKSQSLLCRITAAVRRFFCLGRLRNQLLDAVATLYEIPPEAMTDLRQEDAKRLQRRLFVWSLCICVVFIFLGWVYIKYVSIASEERLANATSQWLSNDTSQQTAALEWFTRQSERETMQTHWVKIAAKQDGVNHVDRGRAIAMVYHLSETPEYLPRPIANQLRTFGESGNAGLTKDTWHTAFTDADFSNLALNRSGLSRLAFAKNNFSNAHFSSSDFSACYFQGINAEDADFRWSSFARANFLGVNGSASFSGSRMYGVIFFRCDFTDASFERCDLTGTQFLNCNLTRTRFTNAYLAGARFDNCQLISTVFVAPDVQLEGVCGKLAGVQFVDSTLDQVTFENADLRTLNCRFYRELSPSPDNYNADVLIFPQVIEGPDNEQQAATYQMPAAKFRNCNLHEVSWKGAMIPDNVFDETTWKQLPQDVRERVRRKTITDEEFTELLKNTSWESIEKNLQLLFGMLDHHHD